MKKREANFELLRIVAMLMIISLHYLDKGRILPDVRGSFTPVGYLAWGMEALCVASVNVYVLVSAYFLTDVSFHAGKVLKLWAQVFFYSAGIGVLCMLTGIVPASQADLYRILVYIFPVVEEHYWFVTAYILMYLFAPFMNEGLKKISQKTHMQAILFLVIVLSVSKSILPVKLPVDRMGYDAVWFLCLYLIGVYIKLHGIPFLDKMGRAAAGFFVCCGLIFASMLCVRYIYLNTGSLGDFITKQYHYNSLFCLGASLCLFGIFRQIRITGESLSRAVCTAASASFGVYLIHEHIELRYMWPVWFGVSKMADTPFFLFHMAASVMTLYGICMVVDLVRQKIFGVVFQAVKDSTGKTGPR